MNRDFVEVEPAALPGVGEKAVAAPVPRLGPGDFARVVGLFFLSRLLILGAAALSRMVIIPGPYAAPASAR